jgi:hypothetical protein
VDDRNKLGESEDDSNCADEPRDYPTPESLGKQANLNQNDVSLDSNQAATPSETLTEPKPSFEPARSETLSFEPS